MDLDTSTLGQNLINIIDIDDWFPFLPYKAGQILLQIPAEGAEKGRPVYPWIEKPSLLGRVPFLLYDSLLVAIVVYMLCCYGYSITTITIPFQLYKRTSKVMAILTDNSIFFSFTLPFIYCFPVPVMDWMEGHYRSRHPLRIANPFNDKVPGVYELIALIIACSIAFSTSKKAAMDCLFVTLFSIQSDFLKYLSVAMSELQKELSNEDSKQVRDKLILWFRLQQEIVRNTHELIDTFSPVIMIYYMTTIGIVVCGAFVQSMKENELVIQSISIGGYIMITLVYYFLLSNTADELTAEHSVVRYDEEQCKHDPSGSDNIHETN
ncbi:unnamed protein product [Nezara viridula]|uniref:Odorant receptor n=1 Tax=Nezara viridula TaxID=85310 RepID=A0A9P0HNW6_NEZVI|nr:unnamed protein product [Nezara viridula]